jgi:hypothetical protein
MPRSSGPPYDGPAQLGAWTVLDRERRYVNRRPHLLCQCACGNQKLVRLDHLKGGDSTNCGCVFTTHNQSESRTYNIWLHLKARCLRPTHPAYADYGGRGIAVHIRWLSFAAFLEDMSEAPTGHSIERIDNNRGYEPGNCRWATPKEQSSNRRSTIKVTLDGETKPLSYWADDLGINRNTATIRYRQYRCPLIALYLKEPP